MNSLPVLVGLAGFKGHGLVADAASGEPPPDYRNWAIGPSVGHSKRLLGRVVPSQATLCLKIELSKIAHPALSLFAHGRTLASFQPNTSISPSRQRSACFP